MINNKVFRVLLITVTVTVILFFLLLCVFKYSFSNNHTKSKIVTLVIENENLLKLASAEIIEFGEEISYISTTEKSTVLNSEYDALEGLYIRTGSGVYKCINNDILDEIMKIKGLISVSISEDMIIFNCGGSGFGSASSYYGFYYTENKRTPEDRGLTQKDEGWEWKEMGGDNWYYTEKITENFYYREMHY